MNIALSTRECCRLTDFWASLYIIVDCTTISYPWSGVLFEQLSWSTGHEIPWTLLNPKIYYRVHSILPLVLVLSEINPVHTTHSVSCRSVLILSSHLRLGLPSELFPSRFPIKPLYSDVLPHTCQIFRPSHSS
jgi:hypothetical protein